MPNDDHSLPGWMKRSSISRLVSRPAGQQDINQSLSLGQDPDETDQVQELILLSVPCIPNYSDQTHHSWNRSTAASDQWLDSELGSGALDQNRLVAPLHASAESL